jgi:hypothetical protein
MVSTDPRMASPGGERSFAEGVPDRRGRADFRHQWDAARWPRVRPTIYRSLGLGRPLRSFDRPVPHMPTRSGLARAVLSIISCTQSLPPFYGGGSCGHEGTSRRCGHHRPRRRNRRRNPCLGMIEPARLTTR